MMCKSINHAILIVIQHRQNILDSVRFEVFTAVTMKNGVFWVVTTRATRRNNPEDTIPHSRFCFCLKHFALEDHNQSEQ
jgi:hypothetical protein